MSLDAERRARHCARELAEQAPARRSTCSRRRRGAHPARRRPRAGRGVLQRLPRHGERPGGRRGRRRGLQEYGAGTASVRFICGTFAPHLALEADLADFVGTAAAVSYVSCWDANAAAITVLADADTVVLSDELNHASIVDAIRLSRAGGKVVYPHSDLAALETALRESSAAPRGGWS